MKVISIVGKADKKPITYPMIKILSMSGQLLILTDDPSYRRLYKGSELEGEVCGAKIRILSNVTSEKISEEIRKIGENECDYVLVVTELARVAEADVTICMCMRTISFMGTALDEFSEKEPDAIKVFLAAGEYDKGKWKAMGTYVLPWTELKMKYILDCEERSTMLPYTDKKTLDFISAELSEELGLSDAAIRTAAKRKVV